MQAWLYIGRTNLICFAFFQAWQCPPFIFSQMRRVENKWLLKVIGLEEQKRNDPPAHFLSVIPYANLKVEIQAWVSVGDQPRQKYHLSG